MKNYEFTAIKKPIPVKFIDPLKANDEELKAIIEKFKITIKDRKWYMKTLESNAFGFTPETHLIVDGAYGDPYPIGREIFEKSYNECSEHTIESYLCINNQVCTQLDYTPNNEGIPHSIEWDTVFHIIKTEGLKEIECNIQNGAKQEVGTNGIQLWELLHICLMQYKEFQEKFPCIETAIIITKIEEALMWDEKRTRARIKRGVEGFTKE
jgi:hypothetical protein